ncbi:Indoleamine 2,3-dioxygenase 1 [Zancudomyces culisetae]|uniref:Indoleamine 2,3-dioxygenase 1 n=1 Tax=Zancudomyces culisetae TaxID=1213189 RepID=A0A1R1PNF0_ZANCU|nr:Indoleamine 2,3-dioxygenase 1 [Zancudomyces culisetae]|eukprot:OMH82480.1 Indoleamine 2,3-dioxygenase 1 [Zancudomyces culisetae]
MFARAFRNSVRPVAFAARSTRNVGTASRVLRQAQPLNSGSINWENPVKDAEFFVSGQNGFLPRQDPLEKLPEQYKELEELMNEMPLTANNGKGLLALGKFGEQVDARLPLYDLTGVTDQRLLAALFRDYTFLASAYLLEPCDIQYLKTGSYGLGRQTLPKNIAVPLEVVAEKIGAKPFMEYALSYALYNYKRIDKSKPAKYDNLKLIRGFSMCPNEHGFILVHVDMVSNSGRLVTAANDTLAAVRKDDRGLFDVSLENYFQGLLTINKAMDTMWKRSDPGKYNSFRTFIMGTKNQPMFPNGVIYEGSPNKEPRFYRGESGANDSMVPLSDNLFELTSQMPDNPLSKVLKDFRSYRPVNHHSFLSHVETEARNVGVQKYAMKNAFSAAVLLKNLDQIRDFRHRHWTFTKEYIIKNTTHPTATGGSPIVTWLPNQLTSVLNAIYNVSGSIDMSKLDLETQDIVDAIRRRGVSQLRVLEREVSDFQQQKEYADQSKYAN